MKEVEVGLGKNNIQVIYEGVIEIAIVGLGQVQEPNTNRDRIRCFKCREYDHFTKDCPTSQVEKEPEQIQQMYNMDKDQRALKALATDTYDSLNNIHSADEIIVDHLNV